MPGALCIFILLAPLDVLVPSHLKSRQVHPRPNKSPASHLHTELWARLLSLLERSSDILKYQMH